MSNKARFIFLIYFVCHVIASRVPIFVSSFFGIAFVFAQSSRASIVKLHCYDLCDLRFLLVLLLAYVSGR